MFSARGARLSQKASTSEHRRFFPIHFWIYLQADPIAPHVRCVGENKGTKGVQRGCLKPQPAFYSSSSCSALRQDVVRMRASTLACSATLDGCLDASLLLHCHVLPFVCFDTYAPSQKSKYTEIEKLHQLSVARLRFVECGVCGSRPWFYL